MSRIIKITVISDFICPFCYIGHTELSLAVSQCADLPISVEIEYRPYSLTVVPDGAPLDKKEYHLNKLGPEKLEKIGKALKEWSDNLGLAFKLNEGVVSSTVRAHRLTAKAYRLGGQRLQLSVLTALFKAYTSDAKDIGSLEVLGDIAESTGLMAKEGAIEFLKGDELKDEVMKMAEDAKGNGIKGVPITIIDGKWALSGAQKAEVFVKIFEKLASAGPDSSAPSPLATVLETDAQCKA